MSEGRYNIPECFVHAGFLFVGPLHTLSHPSNIPVSGYFLQKKLQLSGAQGSDPGPTARMWTGPSGNLAVPHTPALSASMILVPEAVPRVEDAGETGGDQG